MSHRVPDPLSTLHEVLVESALGYPRTKASTRMEDRITQSVAIERSVKERVDAICLRHGTTASAFLRTCAVTLLTELGEDVE